MVPILIVPLELKGLQKLAARLDQSQVYRLFALAIRKQAHVENFDGGVPAGRVRDQRQQKSLEVGPANRVSRFPPSNIAKAIEGRLAQPNRLQEPLRTAMINLHAGLQFGKPSRERIVGQG